MNEKEHVCPIWVGYLLANPIRKFVHNPDKILLPFVKTGMKVVEIGPGMGFYSIPLARMVKESGMVYCVDIQQVMLDKIVYRAKRKGLRNIAVRQSNKESYKINDLKEQIDFVLLFAVVHEVYNESKLFKEVSACLKPGGKILFAEPKGHVTESQVMKSISIAEGYGLKKAQEYNINKCHSVILNKE
jgi:ubiquinone/menaquinone biosynthesis C-methylase UbiE